MSVLSRIGEALTGGASGVVGKVVDRVIGLIPQPLTAEQRAQVEAAALAAWREHVGGLVDTVEKAVSVEMVEVTKRWQSDAASDSWLSKNIRPLSLAFSFGAVTLLAVADSVDSIGFTVAPHWVELFSGVMLTIIVAYFGSRGVEKVTTMAGKAWGKDQ